MKIVWTAQRLLVNRLLCQIAKSLFSMTEKEQHLGDWVGANLGS
jgi:hypothetical protein